MRSFIKILKIKLHLQNIHGVCRIISLSSIKITIIIESLFVKSYAIKQSTTALESSIYKN